MASTTLARASLWFSCLAGAGACDPFHAEFDAVEPAQSYRAARLTDAPDTPDALRLMNYNVKFGGGRIDFFFDCHGDRVLMSRAEVLENLDRIALLVNALDPDVVFMQEVDVNSKRSAYVDQLQYLLDQTELNYAVYASQWRVDFVPSDGIGPVDSGNAILSKYPLRDGTRYQLPLRTDQPALDRYFYLRRNVLTARLELDGRDVGLVATHAEAYSQDGTKREHIRRFEHELGELAARGIAVGAGDLNTLPPGSERTSGFDDSVCEGEFEADDFRQEGDWLTSLYDEYESAIALADYQADNARYFTHTTAKDGFWNRTLDYVFANAPLEDGRVHQDASTTGIDTMQLSDHAPVTATLVLEQRP